jgi:hypothetical protein
MTSGLPEREVQAELVARMQPLDGTETRAWPTPDPWSDDRLFRSKRDQEEWQSLANAKEAKDKAVIDADWRIYCAGWRREQRRALMTARRRALALKLSDSDGDDPSE